MISIVIPVYQEQKSIPSVIEQLHSLEDQNLLKEILVVQCHGEEYSIPTIISPHKGRAAQMNYGATIAKGKILLFLHADTTLPLNALSLIANARTGAFSLRFDSPRSLFKIIAFFTSLRSRLLRLPYGDQAMFMTREVFEKAGGFNDIPILEDVCMAEKIRPKVLPHYVTTSCKRYKKQGILKTLFQHRVIMLGHFLGINPETLSHWR